MFFKPKKTVNAIESTYQPIPIAVLGPVVDNSLWHDIVASAGSGMVENGAFAAVRELRTAPPPVVILPITDY